MCVVVFRTRGTDGEFITTGLTFYEKDLHVAEWTNAHSDAHDYRPRVRKVGRDGKVSTVGTVVE
jgi:hypothetical protein